MCCIPIAVSWCFVSLGALLIVELVLGIYPRQVHPGVAVFHRIRCVFYRGG